jgi:hypothetical protein
LVITGRLDDFRDLWAEATTHLGQESMKDWWTARELYSWVRRYPEEAYKCGLACIDQLGRLTTLGAPQTSTIFYRDSSFAGYDAAQLMEIAGDAGFRVSAILLEDFSVLPVPSVVHLRVEHFVVIQQRDGYFYRVMDPVREGARWLTAEELAQEATGCMLVSANSDVTGGPLNSRRDPCRGGTCLQTESAFPKRRRTAALQTLAEFR